jgi:small-conductance mechanosensitive channel
VAGVIVTAVLAAVGALLMLEVVHRVLLRLGRRSMLLGELARRAHRPAQAVVVLVALQLAIRQATTSGDWRPTVLHALWLGLIAAGAWLVAALLVVLEDVALSRYRTDVQDNRHARKVHTQIMVVRRVTIAAVALVAIGSMLVTFPAARAAGASLLASAGVAGVIAGLAAQSLLSNAFAGIQLAFSDALRLDDVVVVEKEWGRIEEITLSYVVVHIWDDRRLILPSSYFTSRPYENWTRNEAAVLGTVELDVDWTVPMDALRAELDRVLAGTELWDGRVGVLQVTDAVGVLVRVRALVSAVDAPTLWDLRCLVREALVGWLQEHHPGALPRIRTEVASSEHTAAGPRPDDEARVFGGSPDGRQRSEIFAGSGEEPPPGPTG